MISYWSHKYNSFSIELDSIKYGDLSRSSWNVILLIYSGNRIREWIDVSIELFHKINTIVHIDNILITLYSILNGLIPISILQHKNTINNRIIWARINAPNLKYIIVKNKINKIILIINFYSL